MDNISFLSEWTARLKDWMVEVRGPEKDLYLKGFVSDHPHFPVGTYITTGKLISLDPETLTISTQNGIQYILEEPDKNLEAEIPNVKQLLFSLTSPLGL